MRLSLPLRAAICSALLLSTGACAVKVGSPPPPIVHSAPVPQAAPAPLSDADQRLTATLWVQTAPEFRAVSEQVYALATERLPEALRQSGSAALEQADGGAGKPPAVVFDVDETVLDNSPFEARMIRAGKPGIDRAAWDAWLAERRAAAIPGAVAFVKALRAAGVRAVFLTNRACAKRPDRADPCPQDEDTRANLEAAGFGPVSADDVMLVGEKPGWTGEKGIRRTDLAASHRIVMLVGDQLTDMVSVPRSADAAARRTLADRHSDRFGRRWFMLPNAMYGQWLDRLPEPRTGSLRAE